MSDNVRAALALVARGEAGLGIVYETDAKVEKNVKIVGAFPANSHPAIVYPVAATTNAKPEATGVSCVPAAAASPRRCSSNTASHFLVRPTS